MNKIIKTQLEQVQSTKLEFSNNTREIFIPKTIKVLNTSLKVGQIVDIELSPSVTDKEQGATLAANWNRGLFPKYSRYTVEVVSNMAKMIKVNGVAMEDNTCQFYGWLPHDGFTVIKRY